MSTTPILNAGAARCVITPRVGCWMIGPEGPSTGIHDDLYARALVIDDGSQSCAILGLDVVGFTVDFSHELRDQVQRKANVDTVLINCSHNHSAPFSMPWSVEGWRRFCDDEGDWRAELLEKLPAMVESALATRRPATLHAGRAPVEIGFNRRTVGEDGGVFMQPNPDGNWLPWVDTLYACDQDEQPIAVLYSHAAHPVIVHGATSLISADYPGPASAVVEKELGGDAVALFAQGCGADINGEPLRGGHAKAEAAGLRLGAAVQRAIAAGVPVAPGNFRIDSRVLDLPCQALPDMESCDRATEDYKRDLAKFGDDAPPWNERDKLRRLEDLKGKIERGERQSVSFEITTVAIGADWSLVAMPHEVFSAYGLWIEEHSPAARTMTLAYTNGCEIYVPTDDDLELGVRGGYEAACFPAPGCASLAYWHRAALAPGVEGRIKDAVREMWG